MTAYVHFSVGLGSPFFFLFNRLRFGKNAVRTSEAAIRSAEIPVLLFHGDADPVAPLRLSTAACFAEGTLPFAEVQILPGRYHNVYQSKAAEEYLTQTFANLAEIAKLPPEEQKVFYDSLDFKRMTEEDEDVMAQAVDFLKKHL